MKTVHEDDASIELSDAEGEQGRRALSSLDRGVLALVVALLIMAPVAAGWFATPQQTNIPPADALGYIQILGGSLIALLAAGALFISILREWQRPVAIGPVAFLSGTGLILALWAGLTIVLHQPVSHLALNGYAILLSCLVVGGLVSRLGRDRKALMLLLLVVVGAGTLAAIFGVREYLEYWRRGDYAHRVFGSFSGPNFLAGYLLLCLPLTLSCFVSISSSVSKSVANSVSKSGLKSLEMSRSLLGLCLIIQSICLLLTASRAGIGMLVLVLLIWVGLLARAGLLRPHARSIGLALSLVLVFGLLASVPLFRRVASTNSASSVAGNAGASVSSNASSAGAGDAQGHSGKFRQYTWLGTLHMVRANPLLGTGIGNFEIGYPRYSITAFTAHAHNSFLQLTAETGLPGLVCLLVILASSFAFGAYVLFLQRDADPNANTETLPTPALPYGFAEPRLLLGGLLAAMASSVLHSLFESDWYVVATAITLSAMVGLMVAVGRDLAPLATQTPRPLSRPMLAGCLLIVAFLVWRGGTTYLSRVALVQGLNANFDFQDRIAHRDGHSFDSLQSAIDSYKRSSDLDPFNPEPLLTLSMLYQIAANFDFALTAHETATRVSPTAKTFYQLGQYHRRIAFQAARPRDPGAVSDTGLLKGLPQPDDDPTALTGTSAEPASLDRGELKKAQEALQRAHDLDPHSLQTLRVLAETEATLGNTDQALSIYREIEALEETPLGTVRAIPEIIEPDFAFAHGRLALYLAKHQDSPATIDEALVEYSKAAGLLSSYWNNRKNELYQVMNAERRRALTKLYATLLEEWQKLLKRKGGEALQRLPAVQQEQERFLREKQQDQQQEKQAAEAAASPSPAPDRQP